MMAGTSDFRLGKKATADWSRLLEDGELNPLNRKQFSVEYRDLLKQRRDFPVYKARKQFLDLYRTAQVMILTSDTASGKTTQIPQFVLYDDLASPKQVVCTQPRRLATTNVAERVSQECDVALGQEVGYKIRFDDKTTKGVTRLTYITDGVLTKLATTDGLFSPFRCVIIDEAHERSVNTDVLLALLKKAVHKRNDLKVVVMSATMEGEKFARYFDGAQRLHIPGQPFEVTEYFLELPTPIRSHLAVQDPHPTGTSPPPPFWAKLADVSRTAAQGNYTKAALRTVMSIHHKMPPPNSMMGDILLFLTGEDEIMRMCDKIHAESKGDIETLPLFSGLPMARQNRVFRLSSKRRCIVTTNVAETSLSIPRVTYVIDTGLQKEMLYKARTQFDMLLVGSISQASALQRKGRAGPVGPGSCFHLYTKWVYDHMLTWRVPEVMNTALEPEILSLKTAGFEDLVNFDWLDPPATELLFRGTWNLMDMGLLDHDAHITPDGRAAAVFPIDPVWYNAIKVAGPLQCRPNMLTIASIATLKKPIFCRPRPYHRAADLVARAPFFSPGSDHITEMNAVYAYGAVKKQGKVNLTQWCFHYFLDPTAIEEALRVREQLEELALRTWGDDVPELPFAHRDYHLNLRKALALGLLTRSAIYHANLYKPTGRGLNQDVYRTVHDNCEAILAVQSGLCGEKHGWVVYSRFMATWMQVLHTVTAVELDWVKLIETPYKDHPFLRDERLPKKWDGVAFAQQSVKDALDEARIKNG
ncbi:pre-mRNA-splicing factor ATP-dependent RNA helicase PRP43 [Apiospora sp. TS-2023a]